MFLNHNNKQSIFIYKYSLKFFLLSFPALLMSACATSHRGKVFESMAIGAVVGGLYGQSRPEFKDQNSLMYASVGGALGSVYAEFKSDIDNETQKKIEAFNELERTMQTPEINTLGSTKNNQHGLSMGPMFNGSAVVSTSRIPQKLKKVLSGGNLTGFKTDEWIDWGSNRAAHIDEIWELNPAEFNLEK